MKRSGYLVIALISIFASCQLLLPIAAETMIERSLKRSMQAAELDVEVDALPAFDLIDGSADKITISGRDVLIGRLLCSRIDVSAHDVDVDMPRLVNDGKFIFEHLGEVSVTAEIKEDAMAKTLEQSADKLSNVKVTVTPSGIEAEGDYSLGKMPAHIALTGQLVGRGDKIYFVSERATIKHSIGKISANLKTEIELAELSSLPFAVRITEIRPNDGWIRVCVDKEDISVKHIQ